MTAPPSAPTSPRIVVAHPSPDLYGSDRQLLETVGALVSAGWTVEVTLPADGPLLELLEERGARTRVLAFPVLRKALLHPRALLPFAWDAARSTWTLLRELRGRRPDVVLVNTITVPTWLLAARLARVPALCHVHEAEDQHPLVVRKVLAAPLLLARRLVANSHAARTSLVSTLPRLAARTTVVHNGVPAPRDALAPLRDRPAREPARLVLVARLSPRKGIDVALDAAALLRERGHDLELVVCGTTFPGYEWYEEQLRETAASPELAGRVVLAGYVHPTWPELERADVVLVPSRVEPFGNTAVEAMHAGRPLVASRTQGLVEVVQDGRTGLLVEPGDPVALADGIESLLRDPDLARRLAATGQASARERFSVEAYSAALVGLVEDVAGRAAAR